VHLAYIWISHLSAKNYQNQWNFDEVLTKTNLLSFFGTQCIYVTSVRYVCVGLLCRNGRGDNTAVVFKLQPADPWGSRRAVRRFASKPRNFKMPCQKDCLSGLRYPLFGEAETSLVSVIGDHLGRVPLWKSVATQPVSSRHTCCRLPIFALRQISSEVPSRCLELERQLLRTCTSAFVPWPWIWVHSHIYGAPVRRSHNTSLDEQEPFHLDSAVLDLHTHSYSYRQ